MTYSLTANQPKNKLKRWEGGDTRTFTDKIYMKCTDQLENPKKIRKMFSIKLKTISNASLISMVGTGDQCVSYW